MAAAKTNSIDMLNGPLVKKIFLFALPLLFTSILQQLFNSADSAVVGQFVSAEALAAVGGNSPVITLFVNLFVGLSVGANAVLAMYIGENRQDKIQSAIHTIIVLALASGFALLFIGLVASRPLLQLISVPANVLDDAALYLTIYLAGSPFIMFYNFGSAILRSKGDTRRPLIALIVSGVVNVVLDLVFVLAFGWGVAGVAWATVVSNVVSAAMVMHIMLNEEETFRLHVNALQVNRTHLVAVLKIGLPAGIQGVLFALSNVCVQGGINSFGDMAIAGNSASLTFEVFTYYIITAFSQSVVTFVGQNYAAGKLDRVDRVIKICLISSLGFTCAADLLTTCFGDTLMLVFTANSVALTFGMVRFIHVELLQWTMSLFEITAGAMRGMGHSLAPTIISLVGTCALRFAWMFMPFIWAGDFGMLMNVYPLTWTVTNIGMLVCFYFVRKKAFADRKANGFHI